MCKQLKGRVPKAGSIMEQYRWGTKHLDAMQVDKYKLLQLQRKANAANRHLHDRSTDTADVDPSSRRRILLPALGRDCFVTKEHMTRG
jgi:hypothetical protein